jgi:hypothetical protein
MFDIRYDSDEFFICMVNKDGRDRLFLKFPDKFRGFQDAISANQVFSQGDNSQYDFSQTPPIPVITDSVYVPTGRTFFSYTNRSNAALATKNLDWITLHYATHFDADYKALLKCYQAGPGVQQEFSSIATRILKGNVVRENGRLLFKSPEDSRRRSFEFLSSGTLELLPLMNSISQLVDEAHLLPTSKKPLAPFGTLFIEEPESSVFPITQNDLVHLFAWLSNQGVPAMSYAITTHSPYILTSFNNLIEAGQAARNNPKLHDQVAKIVPEQYWIKEGEFKAYAIENGELKSILNESGFVEGNYLDQVSEVIGNEFDELLRLEYEHTKAS